MAIIKVDGVDLVVGLTWTAMLGIGSEPNEIKKICEDHDSRFGALVRTDDMTVVGLTHEDATKARCGAAWLAGAADQSEILILVEPVTDTESWLCAISHAAPMPEYDVIVNNDEIADRITQLQSGDSRTTVRVFSRQGFIEGSVPGTFTELVTNVKPVKIVLLHGTPKQTIVAAALIAIIIAGGFGGKHYYDIQARTATKQRTAIQSAQQQRASKEDIIRTQQEILATAEKELRSKVINVGAMGDTVNAWFSTFENIPAHAVGWHLSRVECAADLCNAFWARGKGTTVDAFLQAAHDFGWEPEMMTGDLARVGHKPEVLTRAAGLESVPASTDFMNHFTSQMQKLEAANLHFEIKRAEQVKVEMAPAAASGAGVQAAPPVVLIPWKVGKFNLDGKYLFELRDMPQYIDFQNVALTSFAIDVDKKSWIASGNYAVR